MANSIEITINEKDNATSQIQKMRTALEDLRLQLRATDAEANPEKVAELTAEYDKLAAEIKKTEGALDNLDQKQSLTLKGFGENVRTVGVGLTAGLTVPILALGGLITTSVLKAGEDAAKTVGKLEGAVAKELAKTQNEAHKKFLATQDSLNKAVESKQNALTKAMASGNAKTIEKATQELAATQADAVKKLATAQALATREVTAAQADAKTQMDAMDPSLKNMAKSWNDIQNALAPVKEKFQEIQSEILQALVPLLEKATPLLKDFADFVGKIVDWFIDLDPAGKVAIGAIVGMFVAIGPTLSLIGQLIVPLGSLITLMEGTGIAGPIAAGGLTALKTGLAGIVGFLGPVTALIVAVTALIALLNSDFGQSGITAGKQLIAMSAAGATGIMSGNRQKADAVFLAMSQNLGLIGPTTGSSDVATTSNFPYMRGLAGRAGGGPILKGVPYLVGEKGPEVFVSNVSGEIRNRAQLSNAVVHLHYAPYISTASQQEIESKLRPMINSILRSNPGRNYG